MKVFLGWSLLLKLSLGCFTTTLSEDYVLDSTITKISVSSDAAVVMPSIVYQTTGSSSSTWHANVVSESAKENAGDVVTVTKEVCL